MVTSRTVRRLRHGLGLVQVAAAAGFVWAAYGLLRDRGGTPPPTIGPTPPSSASSKTPTRDVHPLIWYAPVWKRDLRQPPVDPVVEQTPSTSPPAPPQLPTLLATFVEGDRAWAQLQTAGGAPRVFRLHETCERFELAAVEPRRAALRCGNETYWLELPTTNSLVRETAP